MNTKIIAVSVKPLNGNSSSSQIDFYSQDGYITCVCHSGVQSANVTGDRVVIITESNNSRCMHIYDANTSNLISVQPC